MSTDTQKTPSDDVLEALEGRGKAHAPAPLAPGFDLGAEGAAGGEELIKLMTELSDSADARSRSTGREFGKELLAHLAGGGVVKGFRACDLVTQKPLPSPETLMVSLVLTDEGFVTSAQSFLGASRVDARSTERIHELREKRAAEVAAFGVGQGARSGVSVLADAFRALRPSLPPESDYFQGKLPYVAQMDLGALLGDANTGAYWCERIQLRPRTDGNGVILEIVFRLRGEGDVPDSLLEQRVRHVLKSVKVANLAVFDNRRSAKGAMDDASPETWLHMGVVARMVPMEQGTRVVCVFNELGHASLRLPESVSGS
ncbi:MAG: hypothetical protein QG668_439 [Patescibacteria group bacterium]|nr:hypothetical protein [Patescibacteria group bacterium]